MSQAGGKHLKNIHADTGRRAKARARGNFRGKEKINGKIATNVLEHGQRDLQVTPATRHCCHIPPIFEQTQIGGNDLYPPVSALAHDGIEVLVNGNAQHGPAELFVVRRQVGAAAAETNPYRTAPYEHLAAPPQINVSVRNNVRNPRGCGRSRGTKSEPGAWPRSTLSQSREKRR